MTTWPAPSDLGNYLGVTIAAGQTAQAQAALNSGKARVRRYCRQQIEQILGDTQVIRGSWSHVFWLPERPVLNVNSIQVTNGSGFVDDLVLVNGTDYRWDRLGMVRRVSYVTGRLLAPASGYWGGDIAYLTCNYDHGYAVLPEPVWDVVLGVAARVFTNPAGLVKEQIGGRYGYAVGYTVDKLTDDEKEELSDFRVSCWPRQLPA